MPGSRSKQNATPLRAMEQGLSLLTRLTAEAPERGVSELARELDVVPSTAHRYAATCLELGYLEQTATRRYRASSRCAELGMAMLGSLPVSRHGRTIVRELRRESGHTASLAILDGTEHVLYLQRLCGFQRGAYALERGLGAGTRMPARASAAGAALLGAHARSGRGEPSWGEVGELVVKDGSRSTIRPRARGLAVAVQVGERQCFALEITVPAAALSAAELRAETGESLRRAASALAAALRQESGDACVGRLAS